MPAAYSHYRLGQLVLDELNQPLKHVLETNQDLFDIGLHGYMVLIFFFITARISIVKSIV